MERVAGIEPAFQPWEGRVLPLNHTRERCDPSEPVGRMSTERVNRIVPIRTLSLNCLMK